MTFYEAFDLQTCIDCNAYDADQVDSFMMFFGDDEWVCHLCAEYRGIEL